MGKILGSVLANRRLSVRPTSAKSVETRSEASCFLFRLLLCVGETLPQRDVVRLCQGLMFFRLTLDTEDKRALVLLCNSTCIFIQLNFYSGRNPPQKNAD